MGELVGGEDATPVPLGGPGTPVAVDVPTGTVELADEASAMRTLGRFSNDFGLLFSSQESRIFQLMEEFTYQSHVRHRWQLRDPVREPWRCSQTRYRRRR